MMTQSKYAVLWHAMLVTFIACFGAWADKDSDNVANYLRDASISSKSGIQDHLAAISGFARPGADFIQPGEQDSYLGLTKTLDDSARDSNYVDLDKKAASFLRIGKIYPMNRFIRIGRLYNQPSFDDNTYPDIFEDEKRSYKFVRIGRSPSSFVRIGKSQIDDSNEETDKRASSFLRIGKSSQHFSDPTDNDSSHLQMTSQFERTARGPSSFVRIGKAPSSFVRIGKAPSSFVRIGKAPSSFVRIGKAPSSFVRIGKAPSSFVRIGKAPSSFVRIGKSDYDSAVNNLDTDYTEWPSHSDKRASSFVRIGKADLSEKVVKKRESSLVETGKSAEDEKRASSFVRIGKSEQNGDSNEVKRASSFVRIGKSEPSNVLVSDSNERGSNFVHFGKTQPSDSHHQSPSSPAEPSPTSLESVLDGNLVNSEESINVANRGSAFVRIGKIPSMAFVRIGKNNDFTMDQADYSRGSRGSQSSFVRIGK